MYYKKLRQVHLDERRTKPTNTVTLHCISTYLSLKLKFQSLDLYKNKKYEFTKVKLYVIYFGINKILEYHKFMIK